MEDNEESNTFYNMEELKNFIINKLNELYTDEEINYYESIDSFLLEYTNKEHSIHYYDFTNLNSVCIFECINYINEQHNYTMGENININSIDKQDKLCAQMLYFIGEEWKTQIDTLYDSCDNYDDKYDE